MAFTLQGAVSGVLPEIRNDMMHLVIQEPSEEALTYLVLDLAYGKVVRATPIIGDFGHGPLMSLLTHVSPSSIQTTTFKSQIGNEGLASQTISIQKTSFNAIDTEKAGCDWELILESMHIAFMQREALRFETENLSQAGDAAEDDGASGDQEERQDSHSEDGDIELGT